MMEINYVTSRPWEEKEEPSSSLHSIKNIGLGSLLIKRFTAKTHHGPLDEGRQLRILKPFPQLGMATLKKLESNPMLIIQV